MKERFRPQPENPKQHSPEAGAGSLGLPPPDPEHAPHEVDLPPLNSAPEDTLRDGQDEAVQPKRSRPRPRLPFPAGASICTLFSPEKQAKK